MTDQSRSSLTIGDLAKRTSVKVQTIRYYETIGLLQAPDRTKGNQRRYDERAVDALRLIRHARDLGFATSHIRDLLVLAEHPEQPCVDATTIARLYLEHVERRIAILRSLRNALKNMTQKCSGRQVATCRVIEALARHAHSYDGVQRKANGFAKTR